MHRRPRWSLGPWSFSAVLLALLAAGWRAPAAVDDSAISQLGLQRWAHELGLAGGLVRDIVEDRRGFLWFATSGGLSRFDGRSFRNYTAATERELPGSQVNAIAIGPEGLLWIGLDHGGVRLLEGGGLRRSPRVDALPPAVVRSLLVDADGTLWIGTDQGLWRAGPQGPTSVPLSSEARPADVVKLAAARDGSVWVRTYAHGIRRIAGGSVAEVPDAPDCRGLSLAFRPDGGAVTSCVDGIWERGAGAARWTLVSPAGRSQRLLVDRAGALWYGEARGLVRRSPGGGTELLTAEDGLGDWRIRALYEDSRGDVWVGTYSEGVSRLRRGAVLAFGPRQGLPVGGTTAIVADAGGDFWLGTSDLGLFRWRQGSGLLGRWTTQNGLPSSRVWTIASDLDRADRLWLGTGRGIAVMENGSVRRIARPGGRTDEEVRVLYADPAAKGTIWAAGAEEGADELRDGIVVRHGLENGLSVGQVRVFHRDRSGALFAAGQKGLFRFDGARWCEVALGGGGERELVALAEQKDGTLWLTGPGSGLVRWSGGAVLHLGEREGLPSSRIHSLELDGTGGLWLSGDDGLVLIRIEEVDRWARGEISAVPTERLSARDGMSVRECNGWGRPASCPLPDGSLAYPTLTGMAMLRPSRLRRSALSPSQLFIDRASTGNRELEPIGPFRLARDERDLRVRFGAVEFEHPESIRFRYRLEGLDAGWVNVGQGLEAVYSHLAPGRYRFRMQARLPGQEWVEAGFAPAVEVTPRAWESTGLRLLAAGLVLFAAAATVGSRLRLQREHARELVRERAFLRAVVDTSPYPIFAKTTDLAYSLANRAAAAVFGLRPEEMEGRAAGDLSRKAPGMDRIVDLDRDVIATGSERVLPEAKITGVAGEERWYQVVGRPLLGPSGQVEQVVGTAVDITAFKLTEERLRQSEAQLAASREEMRQLASDLLRAQEEERAHLARELHDDLTQRLAGLAMLTGGYAQGVRRGSVPGLAQSLEEVGLELERMAADSQALSRELHPSLLENLGIEAALRAECSTFGTRTGLHVEYVSRGVPARVPPEMGIVLYRITQESLRNALSHSGSAQVRVTLDGSPETITLSIEDFGSGFDPARRGEGRGLGVASMTERAHLIGAELEIDSGPGEGTRVRVRAPWSQGGT